MGGRSTGVRDHRTRISLNQESAVVTRCPHGSRDLLREVFAKHQEVESTIVELHTIVGGITIGGVCHKLVVLAV